MERSEERICSKVGFEDICMETNVDEVFLLLKQNQKVPVSQRLYADHHLLVSI